MRACTKEPKGSQPVIPLEALQIQSEKASYFDCVDMTLYKDPKVSVSQSNAQVAHSHVLVN